MPDSLCLTAALQLPWLDMHIGIAEDDLDQAALIGLWLEGAGHSARAFGTAAAYIEALKKASLEFRVGGFDGVLAVVRGQGRAKPGAANP